MNDSMQVTCLPASPAVWVSINDSENAEAVASLLQSLDSNVECVLYSNVSMREKHFAPPLCIVTDGDLLDLQALHDIRINTWPVPAIFMSDGNGRQFSMRNGVYMVVETPIAANSLRIALSDTVSYASRMADYFQRRQSAREILLSLSMPQRLVLQFIVDCQPNKIIAKQLDVSVRTIDYRKREIFRKLRVGSLRDLFDLLSLAEGLPWELEQFELRSTLSTAEFPAMNRQVNLNPHGHAGVLASL